MDTESSTPSPRPLGFWLRVVDRLIEREFESAIEDEGVTRRDWRQLNLLADDTVAPECSARLRRSSGAKLASLVRRRWIVKTVDGWTLTDDGRDAHERLGGVVTGIREKVAGAVSDQDFATTLASLEAIARGLGWDPSERAPRSGRHGFGRRGFADVGVRGAFGHGPGPREGFGLRDDHHHHGEHGLPGCEHGGRRPHWGGRGHADRGERAFERGFDAGFARGRESLS